MTLLFASAAAFAVLVIVGRASRLGGQWRPAAAVLAMGALVGAAVAGVRSEWLPAAGLAGLAGTLAWSARRRG